MLVLGGSRSGKSAHAESLLSTAEAVDYLATAVGGTDDAEWQERIAAHQARRPPHWRTIETLDVADVLREPGSPLLWDSVTTWLAGALDASGIWTDSTAGKAVDGMTESVAAAWAGTSRTAVAVSDEVGSGIVPESASGRLFRDRLGLLNQRLAATADEVWWVVAGIAQRIK